MAVCVTPEAVLYVPSTSGEGTTAFATIFESGRRKQRAGVGGEMDYDPFWLRETVL